MDGHSASASISGTPNRFYGSSNRIRSPLLAPSSADGSSSFPGSGGSKSHKHRSSCSTPRYHGQNQYNISGYGPGDMLPVGEQVFGNMVRNYSLAKLCKE